MRARQIMRVSLAALALSLPAAAVAGQPETGQSLPPRATIDHSATARPTTDGEELAKALRLMHWSAEKAAANTVPLKAPLRAAADARAGQSFLFLSKKTTPATIAPPVPQGSVWMNFARSRARGPFEQVYPLIW
jgi:hypothetical protein